MAGSSRPPAAPAPPGIAWDETAWPVVQIKFTDAIGDERFLWILKKFEGLLARRERYLFIIDTTQATKVPSASARHEIGKWQDEYAERTKRWCAGGVIVVSSALVRGALTAMSWVHSSPVKQHYAATVSEGVEWCLKSAEDAGVTVSAAARRILPPAASQAGR